MSFKATRNPDHREIERIITGSKVKAARRIIDTRSGDHWVWDASLATHAEGAKKLGVPYALRPGEGDILTL